MSGDGWPVGPGGENPSPQFPGQSSPYPPGSGYGPAPGPYSSPFPGQGQPGGYQGQPPYGSDPYQQPYQQPGYGPPGPQAPPGFGPPPGGGFPPGFPPPPPPKKRGGLIAVIIIGVVVLLGLGGGGVYLALRHGSSPSRPGTSGSPRAGGSRSASASPSAAPSPTYGTLPDACALGTSLPQQVKGVTPERNNKTQGTASCKWELFQPTSSADLRVEVKTPAGAADQVAAAHAELAGDQKDASDPSTNGGVPPNPQAVPGLGEEAFTTDLGDEICEGPDEQHVTCYWMAGSRVEARGRNVLVDVEWQGATYSGGSGPKKGTNFPAATARAQAVAIIKVLLAGLK